MDVQMTLPDEKILSVQNLCVTFQQKGKDIEAVRDVSFDLYEGEIFGIIGETGSGKSVTCKAITRLLPDNANISGSILYRDNDLLKETKRSIASYRGSEIATISQDPIGSLNPIKTIFHHLKQALLRTRSDERDYRSRSEHLLQEVHIPSPRTRMDDYPFQFSGGMAQRVQIAMAMSTHPKILIADEPTTALDVTLQKKILKEMKLLCLKKNVAMIFISHDVSLVGQLCERVAVMYHSSIVEMGNVDDILTFPLHPYTAALLAAVPKIGKKETVAAISGDSLAGDVTVEGCDFAPRCPYAKEVCHKEKPPEISVGQRIVRCHFPLFDGVKSAQPAFMNTRAIDADNVLMKASYVKVDFPILKTGGIRDTFTAVNEVSFALRKGEIFGIVGESGCGKSTLAKALVGLNTPSYGMIEAFGQTLHTSGFSYPEYTKKVQYVFQDPLGALDPRMTILDQVAEPLVIHSVCDAKEALLKADQMLTECGLQSSLFHRKPYNLSGGQRQRSLVARALIIEPEILICDEPVSAMDVSVQAQIMNLIKDLAHKRNMSVIFISHDLSVIFNMCDTVAVMYKGSFVERSDVDTLFFNAKHPYTQQLIDSIQSFSSSEIRVKADESHSVHACAFYERCPKRKSICAQKSPKLITCGVSHEVACFYS
ncbi:MAG: ABC transporter ATP-binding protein [Sphaerochaetaceae bacterium]|nr:ABC transporter ATP-binding protein [Sphaerochaetaceae bacterium]